MRRREFITLLGGAAAAAWPLAAHALQCMSPLMADFVAEVGDHGFLVTDH
jgi:hypothetical protein